MPSSAYHGPRRQPPNVTRSERSGLPSAVFHKPVGVLFEEMRILFGDKRGDPDGWLEAAFADLLEHALYVSAEGRSGFQPIAHRWLIAVVNLNVSQSGYLLGNEIQIIEYLLGGNFRSETIPGAPTGRRRLRK